MLKYFVTKQFMSILLVCRNAEGVCDQIKVDNPWPRPSHAAAKKEKNKVERLHSRHPKTNCSLPNFPETTIENIFSYWS